MINLYGKVEGGVFEPYAATTNDPTLVGQEVTMDWIDYDDDAEETELSFKRVFPLTFEKGD